MNSSTIQSIINLFLKSAVALAGLCLYTPCDPASKKYAHGSLKTLRPTEDRTERGGRLRPHQTAHLTAACKAIGHDISIFWVHNPGYRQKRIENRRVVNMNLEAVVSTSCS